MEARRFWLMPLILGIFIGILWKGSPDKYEGDTAEGWFDQYDNCSWELDNLRETYGAY